MRPRGGLDSIASNAPMMEVLGVMPRVHSSWMPMMAPAMDSAISIARVGMCLSGLSFCMA